MSGMRTTGFLSTNGLGVRAEVNGRTVSVGSAAWLSKSGAKLSDEWHARARACQDKGEVVVFCGGAGRKLGIAFLRGNDSHGRPAEA